MKNAKATVFYLTATDPEGRSLSVREPEKVRFEQYKKMTTFETPGLEDVFRRMNVVDGSDIEIPLKLRCRSMSVGDVVVMAEGREAVTWLCAPAGWKPLDFTEGVKFLAEAVK